MLPVVLLAPAVGRLMVISLVPALTETMTVPAGMLGPLIPCPAAKPVMLASWMVVEALAIAAGLVEEPTLLEAVGKKPVV